MKSLNTFGSGRTIRWRHSKPQPQDEEVLANIQARFRWTLKEITSAGGGIIGEPVEEHWRYLLAALFPDDDVVWIGRHVKDTGKPGHAYRFRPAAKWQRAIECPGVIICPNAFRPQSYVRSNANVITTRYLVVESDDLNRDEVGAVFQFLEQGYKMRLRAVVDTAGTSLHGWFEYPPPTVFAQLRDILPRLKCDPAMFAVSQPCRLPGALRDGSYQKLIFLKEQQ